MPAMPARNNARYRKPRGWPVSPDAKTQTLDTDNHVCTRQCTTMEELLDLIAKHEKREQYVKDQAFCLGSIEVAKRIRLSKIIVENSTYVRHNEFRASVSIDEKSRRINTVAEWKAAKKNGMRLADFCKTFGIEFAKMRFYIQWHRHSYTELKETSCRSGEDIELPDTMEG